MDKRFSPRPPRSSNFAGRRMRVPSRSDAMQLLEEHQGTKPERIAHSVAVAGLAVALAKLHFTPAAALPGALFSLEQNLAGVLWARWLARRRDG